MKPRFPAVVAMCALAVPLFMAGCNTASSSQPLTGTTSASVPGLAPITSGSPPSVSFVRAAAAKLEPAVVAVHTMSAIQRQPMTLEDLMLGRSGGVEVRRGAGSGVIISANGYVLTNNHVVAGAQKMNVVAGGKAYDARVVGTDPVTDIAVLQIDAPPGTKFPVATLGDSSKVQVGDWAIAVGNPLDIGTTVTLGIISAIGPRGPSLQGDQASNVLQTDAAINPGNSGGALADADGRVIGINEAIESPTGTFIGIGFAIPINTAHDIAAQLIKNGRISRPYMGVQYLPINRVPPEALAQAGISPNLKNGDVIARIAVGSPAAAAGLQPGDVILSADGKSIEGPDTLSKVIASHKVGDTMTLQISRGGQTQNITVTLQQRPMTYGVNPPNEGP